MKPILLVLAAGSALGAAWTFAAPAALVTAPAATAATAYEIDTVHSTVIFKCKHLGTSWAFGRFDDVTGSIELDDKDPTKSKVAVTIKTASVNTNAKDRDTHLSGADFLDVKQFPTATFQSTAVKKAGEHAFSVTGDLTLHGVKKSVTFDMQHVGSSDNPPPMGSRVGFYGELVIKRADYGVSYGGDMLGAEITLMLSVEGLKK